ncbi:hypothetical protein VV02_01045 [Luteipulveratus mongoliensis]|uniref:HTH cro/C1-type domain-containing protein n=2 Tax=Luteipulveratus mongoliensis TaxID=571913 RepID=A0A0K1JDK4_9MICO|nr:hypothetical protein VV02_01045 [Luteipulveratus mongoliensis]
MKPDVAAAIGRRIRDLRTAQDLSVGALAELSEVSRRMLTQVELGQANPSVALLDRVAAGLRTTFAELIGVTAAAPSGGIEVWSTSQGSWAYLLSATDVGTHSVELWKCHLVRGDSSEVPGMPGAPEVMHHVLEGALEIVLDSGEQFQVEENGSLRLPGEVRRRYRSAGPAGTTFIRVFAMPAAS